MMALRTTGLLLAAAGLLGWHGAKAFGADLMSVQVKKGAVRAQPSFLGEKIAEVAYGDQVAVLVRENDWARVQLPAGAQGWMHASALTTERLALRAGDRNVSQSATSDELALAGKGFNRQVEGEYRARHPRMNFAWVDRMETYVVSEEEIRRFIQEGRLNVQGGAR